MPAGAAPTSPDARSAPGRPDGPGGWAGFRTGAALGIALVVGFVGGRVTGTPVRPAEPVAVTAPGTPGTDSVLWVTGAPVHQHAGTPAAAEPAGLARTSGGLSLDTATTRFEAGRTQPFRFRIVADGGAPVTTYTARHERMLHLVVIRRDLTGFQHLHPVMAPDGTWSTDLTLAAPGSYRAIADFTAVTGGRPLPLTLGVDLTVAGDPSPAPLPPPAEQVATGGLAVRLTGNPATGADHPLSVEVSRPDGAPAVLEPYLGATGHLIAFREGDVAYLHTHAETGSARFRWIPPGPGRYRLFAEFQVAGRVHVAAFTRIVA